MLICLVFNISCEFLESPFSPMITDISQIGCTLNSDYASILVMPRMVFGHAVPYVIVLCPCPLHDGAEQGKNQK